MKRGNAKDGESPTVMWWVGDWLTSESVLAMSRAARSLYFDLLLHQWKNGSLPNDEKVLARLTGEGLAEFQALWSEVQKCFDLANDGRLRNPRMEKERRLTEEYRAAKSAAGRKGADKTNGKAAKGRQKRGGADKVPPPLASANERPSSSASSSSSASESEPAAKGERPAGAGPHQLAGWPTLDTPEAREAWDRWEKYRIERRNRLTPTGRDGTCRTYADRGAGALIAAIDNTLTKNVLGLLDPDGSKPAARNGTARTARDMFGSNARPEPRTVDVEAKRA